MIITGRRMSCTDNDTQHIHRGPDLHHINYDNSTIINTVSYLKKIY